MSFKINNDTSQNVRTTHVRFQMTLLLILGPNEINLNVATKVATGASEPEKWPPGGDKIGGWRGGELKFYIFWKY